MTVIESVGPAWQLAGMGTKTTYALTLSGIMAVFSLLMYFAGFQTEKIATGQYLQWLSFPIMFIVLWLGVRAVRAEKPHQALTYGQGVGAGALISVISGAASAVYTFIHLKFINTNFADYQLEFLRGEWAKAGLGDAQIEQAEAMTRMMMGPTVSAISALIGVCIAGILMSLVIAAFLKRPLPPGVEVPPPM